MYCAAAKVVVFIKTGSCCGCGHSLMWTTKRRKRTLHPRWSVFSSSNVVYASARTVSLPPSCDFHKKVKKVQISFLLDNLHSCLHSRPSAPGWRFSWSSWRRRTRRAPRTRMWSTWAGRCRAPSSTTLSGCPCARWWRSCMSSEASWCLQHMTVWPWLCVSASETPHNVCVQTEAHCRDAPSVTRAGVASRLIQNETHEMMTMR